MQWEGKKQIIMSSACEGIPFVPFFPRDSRLYGFYRGMYGRSGKFGSGCQVSRISTGHKRKMFLKMPRNILTFPQWEKNAVGLGQPSIDQ